jgi:hypothetical protein
MSERGATRSILGGLERGTLTKLSDGMQIPFICEHKFNSTYADVSEFTIGPGEETFVSFLVRNT